MISDAIEMSLLLTDIWHHPQERKSGVALWRWDVGATGQKGPGGAQEITCFASWLRLHSHQIWSCDENAALHPVRTFATDLAGA